MLKTAFRNTKKHIRKVRKNIKSRYDNNPKIFLFSLISLVVFLLTFGLYFFLKTKPNDDIFFFDSNENAILGNKNPTFNISFGKREQPEEQWVRFEAKGSAKNPFEEEEGNVFTKIVKHIKPKKEYGIEMSLEGVQLGETENLGASDSEEVVKSVAEIIGTDEIDTTTELVEMGRVIGEDTEETVSKETVLNKDVVEGVDIEYQVLEGLGLKEEIVINDLEEYTKRCGENLEECKIPLNEFVFNLKLDEGLSLKEGWYTLEGKSTQTYYFQDSDGNYVAHFLPSWAKDNAGNKTYDVNLDVEDLGSGNYRASVIVPIKWLLSSDRVFPVRIDPSIIHDTKGKFDEGLFDNTMSFDGARVELETVCEGGLVTTDGNDTIHTFTGSDTFTCYQDVEAEVLVVAGGGAGWVGGGGGGGILYNDSVSVSTGDTTITVGSGGSGVGNSGGDSSFGSYVADGGGGGAGWTANGSDGGSGGGGGHSSGTTIGGSATQTNDGDWVGYGNDGGGNGGNNGAPYPSGGGGGAGAIGGTATASVGGDGGDGVAFDISGTSTYYGGGGGGGTALDAGTPGSGGSGGGGDGSHGSTAGTAGTAGTGGGGGGGSDYVNGLDGGSGVVIVRYESVPEFSGTYVSSTVDLASETTVNDMFWSDGGVNTGDGETLYSTTGLLAHWKFNETSGTTADNSEGTATFDGTLSGFDSTASQDADPDSSWTYRHRRWGNGALMFDGTDSYVNVGDIDAVDSANELSVCAWVNHSTLTGDQHIVTKTDVSDAWAGFMFLRDDVAQESGRLDTYKVHVVNTNGDTSYIEGATNSSKVGEWTHVCFTYKPNDAEGLRLFVNGKEDPYSPVSTTDAPSLDSNSANLTIGRYDPGPSGYFDGTMDSVYMYERELSASEILSNYQAGNIEFQYRTSADGSTWSDWDGGIEEDIENFDNPYLYDTDEEGLIAYYPMDETSGSTVGDVAGTNNGTAIGTRVIDGKYNKGRGFDGVSDYVSLGDRSLVDNLANFTIGAWVYTTSNNADHHRVFSENGVLYVGQYSNQISFYMGTGPSWTHTSLTMGELSMNSWHHIVWVKNATNAYVYLDGKYLSTMVAPATLGSSTVVNYIGGASTVQVWDGDIDEVLIYNTALSSSQIQNQYIQGIEKYSGIQNGSDSNIKIGGDNSEKIETGVLGVDNSTVGYWKLDETSGTGAYLKDYSGNGNDGTPTGTTYTEGKVGGARSLDGDDDYIQMNTTDYQFITGDFSVTLWANPYVLDSTYDGLITTDSTSDSAWKIVRDSGNQHFSARYGSTYVAYPSVSTGEWHQYGYVKSGSNLNLYLDGEKVSTTSISSGITSSATSLVLGSYRVNDALNGNHIFNGNIDEVHISNIARTSSEIYESYNMGKNKYLNKSLDNGVDLTTHTKIPFWLASDELGNNLELTYGDSAYANYQTDENTVGYWRLDEEKGSGAYIKDYSGNNYNGTPTGTTYTEGKVGGARSFNGTSDYIKVPQTTPFNLQTITISSWVKFSDDSTSFIFEKGNVNTQYSLFSHGTDIVFRTIKASDGTTDTLSTSKEAAGIKNNSWTHIVATFDGSNKRVYVNGNEILNRSWPYEIQINSNDVSIGRFGGTSTGYYFTGSIDEVRIDSLARTPSEIKQAYEVGKRKYDINVDFKADLQSSNLITGSGDTSFSISETAYGTTDEIENINIGDKIIVKENYDGTEYIAQGTVDSINVDTGTTTVSSWDSTSTFPSVGFSVNASVFKWQREYIDIRNVLPEYRNNISLLTFRLKNQIPATYWIDEIKASRYLGGNSIGNTEEQVLGFNDDTTNRDSILKMEGERSLLLEEGDTSITTTISSKDISMYERMPFWIASDRLGTNTSLIYGDSEYANYETDANTVGYWKFDSEVEAIEASGGSISDVGTDKVHTFTSDGTFSLEQDVLADILIVGGGGGGGGSNGAGGGGGAGGVLYSEGVELSSGDYSVDVGSGGSGSGPTSGSGVSGDNSSFGSILTAIGGGGGGGYDGSSTTAPRSGGSGGGGGSSGSGSFSGASGTSGQGYDGGNGRSGTTSYQSGGGGGGASEPGASSTSTDGGDGGDGISIDITGSSVTYGGGGGGSRRTGGSAGSGGAGGGGNGGYGGSGGSGTDGLGGGGGGGANGGSGGRGGNGVIIVRYSSSTTEDESGNNYDGILSGTEVVEGKLDSGKSFNGSSDYVSVGTLGSLGSSLATTPVNISFWIKTTDTSGIRQFGTINDGANTLLVVNFNRDESDAYSAGGIGLDIRQDGGGNLRGAASVPQMYDGEWHHVSISGEVSSSEINVYIDGKEFPVTYGSTTAMTTFSNFQYPFTFGASNSRGTVGSFLEGSLDEVRIDTQIRSENQIKQAYEVGKRKYDIEVSFKADLQSSNLITNSSDVSFDISEVAYGSTDEIENLSVGDKIIVTEEDGGTKYKAQGTVTEANTSTGAVTVASWDTGSTFPSGGYTTSASVFKWQKEYLSLLKSDDEDKDGVTKITLRSSGSENVLLDDINAGDEFAYIQPNRYFQYRTIFTTWDGNVTPYISSVQVDYTSDGPTMEQIMRHGKWFNTSTGSKEEFWWVQGE